MLGLLAQLSGATLAAYLLLRLICFVLRKVRRQANGAVQIAICGFITSLICIVIAAYGNMDGTGSPQFEFAVLIYFGPSMFATVIELVRNSRFSN